MAIIVVLLDVPVLATWFIHPRLLEETVSFPYIEKRRNAKV